MIEATCTASKVDGLDEAWMVTQTARDLSGGYACPTAESNPAGQDEHHAATAWDHRWGDRLLRIGFTRISTKGDLDGSGGGLREAAMLIKAAGEFGALLPLADSVLLGGGLLAAEGFPLPPGPLAVADPTVDPAGVATITVTMSPTGAVVPGRATPGGRETRPSGTRRHRLHHRSAPSPDDHSVVGLGDDAGTMTSGPDF
ncbi:hypothetical protein [Parafrankia elaeagni]|uniref:hypothetical protein n=1 Tax=Parafrankia elaeagni TaxID=222534 RepID=UPI00037DEA01|nr:hypothetical protein [Parafrankia elaeagni]